MHIGKTIRVIDDVPNPLPVKRWLDKPIPAEKVWKPEKEKVLVPA